MCQANARCRVHLFSLAADPDLGEIVDMFVEEMPGRVASLLDRFNRRDWDGLRQSRPSTQGGRRQLRVRRNLSLRGQVGKRHPRRRTGRRKSARPSRSWSIFAAASAPANRRSVRRLSGEARRSRRHGLGNSIACGSYYAGKAHRFGRHPQRDQIGHRLAAQAH